jgi:hypothetical protein
MPEALLARPPAPGEPVREYVLRDAGFRDAAAALALAGFASNPLDALFAVYDSLTRIKQAANANAERNGRLVNEGTLSFDDTFCLFFVVFLASDLIDLTGLCSFVMIGAPEQLSSTFEYSKTMLEALVLHIEQIEVDVLVRGGY